MATLGIESSAHTLGFGIVEHGRVLANAKEIYKVGKSGIIPAKAADLHANNVNKLLKEALSQANLSLKDIECVGYTRGPGLGPCLRICELAGAAISQRYKIPLMPVNHAVAHIEVTRQAAKAKDPLVLYVSGGNSQILTITNAPYRHYHVHGETLDIGIGNMFDNFAREAQLDPAWGSSVEKAAKGGHYIEMPYTVKGMDFTFTGILTNAAKMLVTRKLQDVAFSLQETTFSMLCEALERALLLTRKKEILISGGVAQNTRLKQMVTLMGKPHGARAYFAKDEFNADNGAMIATVAEKMFAHKEEYKDAKHGIDQKYRIEQFKLAW